MRIEEAIKEIEYAKSFGTSGVVPRWEAIETLLSYVETMHKEFDRLEGIEDNTSMLLQELKEQTEVNKELNKVLIHFKAVINEMAWQLLKEGFCSENDKKDCCKTDDCEECIKEYFYKKVRNNGIKRK